MITLFIFDKYYIQIHRNNNYFKTYIFFKKWMTEIKTRTKIEV